MPNRRYATECKGCGGEVISNMRHCPWCGTKIDRSVFYGKIQGAPKPKEAPHSSTGSAIE